MKQIFFRKIPAFLHYILWSAGKQRDHHSKLGFSVKTDDGVAPTHPETVKRIMTHITEALGESRAGSSWSSEMAPERKEMSWLLSKRQEVSVAVNVEKREPFCPVGGNVNWCNHYGKQYGGSSKK